MLQPNQTTLRIGPIIAFKKRALAGAYKPHFGRIVVVFLFFTAGPRWPPTHPFFSQVSSFLDPLFFHCACSSLVLARGIQVCPRATFGS
jgi:hypothetical protein